MSSLVLFLKRVVFKVLYSISDGYYIKFGNCSVSDEEKERCVLWRRVSYLKKIETRVIGMHLIS
jgi:hypothetical protein